MLIIFILSSCHLVPSIYFIDFRFILYEKENTKKVREIIHLWFQYDNSINLSAAVCDTRLSTVVVVDVNKI
jgi:hypothetical protein